MSQVKFGYRIPSFPIDGSSASSFINQIHRSLHSIKTSFDSVWICDHFIPWADFQHRNTPTLEGFSTICYIAGLYQNLYFGNIVLCNSYRNPALVAKMGAALQTLTKGRFILGIGAGWKEDEYREYGFDFTSTKTRIKQLEESVQIIKKMWTEKEVNFQGKYYTLKSAHCYPKPKPIPPILIGGGGEKLTLRVVARYADWWNIYDLSPTAYQHKLSILRKHCIDVNRNPLKIVYTLANSVAIAENEKQARKLANQSPFLQRGSEENYLIGTPNSVVEKLREYIKIGVEHFILRFVDFPSKGGAELFAKEVVPYVNAR